VTFYLSLKVAVLLRMPFSGSRGARSKWMHEGWGTDEARAKTICNPATAEDPGKISYNEARHARVPDTHAVVSTNGSDFATVDLAVFLRQWLSCMLWKLRSCGPSASHPVPLFPLPIELHHRMMMACGLAFAYYSLA